MASKDSTVVQYLICKVGSKTRNPEIQQPTILTAATIAESLQRLYQSGEAARLYSNGTIRIWIEDMRIDPDRNWAIMLINHASKNEPDIANRDFSTLARRVDEKEETEGLERGAHFIWDLREMDGMTDHYMLYAEQAKGISGNRLQGFLNTLLTVCSRNYRDVFQGTPVNYTVGNETTPATYPIRSVVELSGLPSDEFIDDINEGHLSSLELISHSTQLTEFDTQNQYRERSHSIRFTVVESADDTNKFEQVVRRLAALGRQKDYEKLRISLQRADKKTKTINILTETMGLDAAAPYVKTVSIESPALATQTSYQRISSVFLMKFNELIDEDFDHTAFEQEEPSTANVIQLDTGEPSEQWDTQ